MKKYRNVRAAFLREDGTWIGKDIVFEPTSAELAQYSYKLVPEPEVEEPQQSTEESALTWPMRMDPALYLKLHPIGPHAELAKKLVKEGESSGE
jgi:hypothetical protein